MWGKLMNSGVLILFFFFSDFAKGASFDHSKKLKAKFHYGLLSDDFGILAETDLARNANRFKPEPFPPEPYITPYEYWQCFESKNISFSCNSSDIPDEIEGPMGFVAIKVHGQVLNEYIERRPWPIRECRRFIEDLKKIVKGTAHACISASFIDTEIHKARGKTYNWLFERLKTRKGCEGRGC